MARRRLPIVFHRSDAEALLSVATRDRDRLIISVGLLCGLRVAEITNLQVPDVDFADRRLFVRQGKGGRDRYVPIPERLVEPLKSWIGERSVGWLFPSPRGGGRLCSRGIQYLMKRLARAAGLPEANKPRKYTPHKLRHRYASDVLKKGANIRIVQRLLGHANLATTEIYTHVEDEDLQRAVRDL